MGDQVRQLPADHAKPHRSDAGQNPGRTRTAGNALLEPLFPIPKGIRLLGISLSSLLKEERDDKRKAADL